MFRRTPGGREIVSRRRKITTREKGNRKTIVNKRRKDNRLTRKLTQFLVDYSYVCKDPVMSRDNSALTGSPMVTNLGCVSR